MIKEHADVCATPIGNDEIVTRLSIEIGDGYAARIAAGGECLDQGKSALAIATEDTDGRAIVVGDSNIRDSVAVEIADGQSDGLAAEDIGDRGLQGAVAVAQKNGNGVAVEVGGDQIEGVAGAAQPRRSRKPWVAAGNRGAGKWRQCSVRLAGWTCQWRGCSGGIVVLVLDGIRCGTRRCKVQRERCHYILGTVCYALDHEGIVCRLEWAVGNGEAFGLAPVVGGR